MLNLSFISGTWIDGAIAALIIYYLFIGWRRGFLLGLADLAGILLSFLLSLKYYTLAGQILMNQLDFPKGMAHAIGFLFIGFVAQTGVSLLIELAYQQIYKHLSTNVSRHVMRWVISLDTWLGCIPSTGEALIVASFLLTLILTLPVAGQVKKIVLDSRLGSRLVIQAQGVERQLNAVFGDAVNETLTFLTVNANPSSEDAIKLGFTQPDVTVDTTAEETMFRLVNEERRAVGLFPLKSDPALQKLARVYAKDLFARGYFSHYNPEGQSPFNRMKQADIPYGAAGENLALAPNVTLAHQGLMHSPGHRANILSDYYTRVGIGVVDGGIYGQMFVQEFTD